MYVKGKTYVLSSALRPELLGRWINSRRRQAPVIEDLAVYVVSWRKWWASLQPQSRRLPGGSGKLSQVVETGERWEELRKRSINGFFNVVVSLGWWYAALKSPAQRRIYGEIVDDVSWVLDQLLVDKKHGKKHAMTDLEERGSKRQVFIILWLYS